MPFRFNPITGLLDLVGTEASSSTSAQGLVYIHDIEPTGTGNVGDKVFKTGSNDSVLETCLSDTDALRVYVIAMIGESNLRPAVTVNGTAVGNWNHLAYADDNRVLFEGYADITLAGTTVTANHEDGAEATAEVTADPKPVISIAEFTGGYPGSQTEVKAGDSFDIRVVADLAYEVIEVEDSGACVFSSNAVASGTDSTITSTIADRGTTAVLRPARVRVQKSTGTWSEWVFTNASGSVDGTDVVNCNNLYPSVEVMDQNSVTYPSTQEAIKDSETVTVHSTCSDFDTITYSSPNSELSIPNVNTYAENKASVQRIDGDYNITTDNYRISANRAANDSTTTENLVVYIAHIAATLTVTEPAARLRSGGNDGTAPQDHEITITASQNLRGTPTLVEGAEGIFQGAGFTGGPAVWVRDLRVTDDMTKGTYTWGAISGTNLANIVTSTITGDSLYVIGGFVSRQVTLAAFGYEVDANVESTTYANLAISWEIKALPNKRAVGTTARPDPNSWALDALNTNPLTIRILDQAATEASSVPTTVTIEETV